MSGKKPSIVAFPIAAIYAPLGGEWRQRQISIDLKWRIDLRVPMFLLLNLEGVNDEQGIPIHFRWRSTCNGVGRMSKKRRAGDHLKRRATATRYQRSAHPADAEGRFTGA